MRIKYETILLDALWLSAMALFASFWFDIRFGFNIFSAAHWHYLAVQQIVPGRIIPMFYISIAGFGVATIIGLYFISRPPRHRIKLISALTQKKPEDPFARAPAGELPPDLEPTAPDPNYSPLPPAPNLPRPPRIVSSLSQARTPIVNSAPSAAAPKRFENSDEKLSDVFTNAGYVVKKPPRIGGVHINLFAIGLGEVLYIGLADGHGGKITANDIGDSKWWGESDGFPSPVARISQAAEKVRALFAETLDAEIQINVRPFVVMNDAVITNKDSLARVWDALGVRVFENLGDLAAYINDSKNGEITNAQREDFDAYSEYIDTVADYFNKT
jgi:hypothetical protein